MQRAEDAALGEQRFSLLRLAQRQFGRGAGERVQVSVDALDARQHHPRQLNR